MFVVGRPSPPTLASLVLLCIATLALLSMHVHEIELLLGVHLCSNLGVEIAAQLHTPEIQLLVGVHH